MAGALEQVPRGEAADEDGLGQVLHTVRFLFVAASVVAGAVEVKVLVVLRAEVGVQPHGNEIVF